MTKRTKKPLLLLVALVMAITLAVLAIAVYAAGGTAAAADDYSSLTMPTVFADGMVLQRGEPINIYGYCDTPGAQVKVKLGNEEKTVSTVGTEWCATFDAMDATWGLTLEVTDITSPSGYSLSFKDVAVGEVWVISGQSNAEAYFNWLEDVGEQTALASNYENLRIYRSTKSMKLEGHKTGFGSWHKATPSFLSSKNSVSAIGYMVGARLAAEFGNDVPVAVMHLACGAAKIRAFMDYDSIKEVSPYEAARVDEEKEYYAANGSFSTEKPYVNHGTVLYNSMIYPLDGYTVAGVIWFQGEGDVESHYAALSGQAKAGGTLGTEGRTYDEWFDALRALYRKTFRNSDMPFFVMQLYPYTRSGESSVKLDTFRAMQYDMCKADENSYLVSTAVDGFACTKQDFVAGVFIHPARKSVVGNRCADMILDKVYGLMGNGVASSPEPVSASVSGSELTLTFDSDVYLYRGNKVEGFELYSGTSWVKATGVIDGDKIVLTAPGVSVPKGVRYGYGQICLELSDGSIIEIKPAYETKDNDGDKTADEITVTAVNGTKYTFTADDGQVLRGILYGNITNLSGAPMAVFCINKIN